MTKLREICAEVEAKKLEYRKGGLASARTALSELAESDPEGLPRVLREFGMTGG